ncbi:MAG TPA: segregation/condensation protein A [Acidobacteriota bacterium]|nr:segregation/condensation protein A [Acidobacteriota bacterium]
MESTQPIVELEVFQGPLDLLLYLIHKNEINIYDIPIATITQQYLDHLELMQELNLNVAGEFILMAVQLIEMKIRLLLPKPPSQEGLEDEDLRRPLVEQLLEYQKYKMVAQHLKDREGDSEQFWKRPETFNPEENREELVEANLYDLVHAFALLIKRTQKREALEIRADQFSVKQKIQELTEYLEKRESFSLMEYAQQLESRVEMIVLFLAILEMIRLSMLRIYQGEIFGDIVVYAVDQSEEI